MEDNETSTDLLLELQARAVWKTTSDGLKVMRIEVMDCVMIAPAAAEGILGVPAGVTVH
jgi:hypothetical protein